MLTEDELIGALNASPGYALGPEAGGGGGGGGDGPSESAGPDTVPDLDS